MLFVYLATSNEKHNAQTKYSLKIPIIALVAKIPAIIHYLVWNDRRDIGPPREKYFTKPMIFNDLVKFSLELTVLCGRCGFSSRLFRASLSTITFVVVC